MALLALTLAWAKAGGHPAPLALTVDHRLRTTSASEADLVATRARQLGAAHQTLVWHHGPAASAIQERARAARYGLLAKACAAAGIDTLLLGHTGDDLAETFLMRLARGAGLDGLSGFELTARLPLLAAGLTLVRPLSLFGRAEVRASLRAFGLSAVEDPSNDDARFERARVRLALEDLGLLGIDRAAIAASARRLAADRALIAGLTDSALLGASFVTPYGAAMLSRSALSHMAPPLRARVLGRLIRIVGGLAARPDIEAVERLASKLVEPEFRGATLSGVRFRREGISERVRASREIAAIVPLDLAAGGTERVLFDGRFWITPGEAGFPGGGRIRAIGASFAALRRAGLVPASLPASVGAALPALWTGDRAPLLPLLPEAAGGSADGSIAVFHWPAPPSVRERLAIREDDPYVDQEDGTVLNDW